MQAQEAVECEESQPPDQSEKEDQVENANNRDEDESKALAFPHWISLGLLTLLVIHVGLGIYTRFCGPWTNPDLETMIGVPPLPCPRPGATGFPSFFTESPWRVEEREWYDGRNDVDASFLVFVCSFGVEGSLCCLRLLF